MPFMVGKAPFRRTLKYLMQGTIVFRENVKIFSINYNHSGKHHEGIKEFIFWHMSQIQYKNPTVQCITFKNMTPSPFIRIFLSSGKSILIDVDSRSKTEILEHLQNFTAVCKSRSEVISMKEKGKQLSNPTQYFGVGCQKHCICEILGQVPCSSLVTVPKMFKGLLTIPKEYRIPPHYMQPDLIEEEKEDE